MKTKCCNNPGAVSSHVASGCVPIIHPVSPTTDVLNVNSDAMVMIRRHGHEPAALRRQKALCCFNKEVSSGEVWHVTLPYF